jgi:Domain of unknown function (DUF222)
MSEAVTTRIEAISTAIDTLLSDLSLLPVSVDTLVAFRTLVDKTDLLCSQAVGRVAADGTFRDDGYRDIGALMAMQCHTTKTEGNIRLKRASLLDALPMFGAAAAEGTITTAHIQLLANMVTPARLPFAQRDETVLVAKAIEFDASGFKIVLQHWASLVDDVNGDPTSDDEKYAKRSLQLRQLLNGMWTLNGLLDSATGQVIEAAIEAAMATPTVGDTRNFGQYRHDALADICHETLASDDRPVTGGQRPQVSIIIINNTDGTAHTPNNWYISKLDRDMILCDCITTAIKTCNGIVFDIGTPKSQIPTRNRKATITRDRCCRYPGCDRPARWSDIHHILERENGGCHELDNLTSH